MSQLVVDERGVVVECPSCGQKNRVAFERLDQTVRCGQCKSNLAGLGTPFDVSSSADFDRLVERAGVPVVVDYWAPWCGPCRMVAPELVKLAARANGQFLVVKVNTDVLTDLGRRYGIRSIPTMAVFKNGREVTRTTGARPAAEIEAFVGRAIAT